MSKILIIAGLGSSLERFRGDLIKSWLDKGYIVHAAAPEEEAIPALVKRGVIYHQIPLARTSLNPFKDLKLFLIMCKLTIKIKPDYLFLYTIKPVIYGSIAAYCREKSKVFSMITGLGFVYTTTDYKNRWIQGLVSFLYKVALLRNEKVFFQNPDDRSLFSTKEIVTPKKTILVNGSGVDLNYYRPVELPEGPPVFLLIARMLREKGIYEYIEAASLIKDRHPEVVFRIIGWELEGGASVISSSQIAQWKEKNTIDILGVVEDVRPYIGGCSVYVLPSYREGTPRTVLEAMAMGRPIITTDTPGCRETVVDGVNGFLVPVKDSETLAAAMEKFILNPELIPIMGRESRLIAEEKYDVHKVNDVINRAMSLI